MKPADLALVQSMFNVIAPTAAAEMKARVLAKLRATVAPNQVSRLWLAEVYREIEALPLSKETT